VHRLKRVIMGLTAFLAFAGARAQEFSPNLQQLNHRAFTRLEGAPQICTPLLKPRMARSGWDLKQDSPASMA